MGDDTLSLPNFPWFSRSVAIPDRSVQNYYTDFANRIVQAALSGDYTEYDEFLNKSDKSLDHTFLYSFLVEHPNIPFDFLIRVIMDNSGALTESTTIAGRRIVVLSEEIKDYLVFETNIIETLLSNLKSLSQLGPNFFTEDDVDSYKQNLLYNLSSPDNPSAEVRNVYLKLTIQ